MLTTIIYRSHLREDAPLKALEDMVTAANIKNRRSDVTGILLFNGHHFFQLLEGPEEQVKRSIVVFVTTLGTTISLN